MVIPLLPPYPPPFSYQGETKDLQVKSLYQGETLELAGICLRKSEGKTKEEGKVVWKVDQEDFAEGDARACADDPQPMIAGLDN